MEAKVWRYLKFGALLLVIGSILVSIFLTSEQVYAQNYIIDDFSTDQTVGTLSSPGIIATEKSGSGIIGSERCIEMQVISTTGAALTVGVDSGTFYSGQGPMVTSRVVLVWDGTGGGNTDDCDDYMDTDGLGGVDLTSISGTPQDAFLIVVNSDDFPVDLNITVYDTDGGSDTVVLPLPGGIFTPVTFIVPFSDFSGVDFTKVGAIEIEYQDDDPLDLIIDEFRTTSLPDLTATKSNDTGGTADVGETFNWTVHIANEGQEAAEFSDGQTILTDNLPSGPTYGSPSVQNTNNITGTISCSLIGINLTCVANGDVTINGGGSFDVVFGVTPNQAGSLNNPRSGGICRVDSGNVVDEGDETNNDCSDTVNVQAPDLEASKSDDTDDEADVGETFNWTVHIANTGAADATFANGQTILTDNLPNDATYGTPSVQNTTNVTGSNNIDCSITNNTLTCVASGGSVTINSGGSFDVVFGVTPNQPGTLSNPRSGGICRVDSGYVITETDETNNDCSDTVNVQAPNLRASKSDDTNDEASVGETFHWTVHISNTGTADATFANGQTILTDNLPSGPSYGTPSVQNATDVTGSDNIDCNITNNTLTCVASGGSVTISSGGSFDVVFSVTADTPGSLVNPQATGICRVDSGNVIVETNENDNDCSDTVDIIAPDLRASKSDDTNDEADVGETFNWTVHVSNAGAADATFADGQTILTDELPSGPTYGTPSVQNATNITGNINCNLADTTITCVANGNVTISSGGSFDVVFSVTPHQPGALNNPGFQKICRVDSGNVITETDETNNDCQDSVTVVEPAVQAFKAATLAVDADSSGGPSPGDTLLYEVTISNFDTTAARGVVYTDTPDPNTTLEVGSVTTTQGIVVQGNNPGDTSIEVDIGDIGVGSSVVVTYMVTINDPLPPDVREIVNQGLVSGDNFPDVPTDNPATPEEFDETRVRLQEVVGADPPIYGDIVVFPTPELSWGLGPDRDFNRDRDTRDCVLRYKNLKTGMVVNTGLIVSCRAYDIDIYENIIVFVGQNGEIRYYDIASGAVKDLGIRGLHPTIYKEIIAFSSGGEILYYDLKKETLTATGVWGKNPVVYGDIIAYAAGSPSTICYYNIRTGEAVDTAILGETPALYEGIIAFATEEGLIGEDLNHDGDLRDKVIRYYNLKTDQVYNTGASGETPAIYGRHIAFVTRERSAGKDLNGDGDLRDWVIRYYDIKADRVYNTARLGVEPDIYENIISFWVFEPLAQLDINGDGDRSDPIVQTYRITTAGMEQAVTPLVVTGVLAYPNPAGGESVRFVAQGQGITALRVQIYDLAGREVFRSRFVDGKELVWRLTNNESLPVANGVYLYIITVKGFNELVRSEVRKLAVLR